MPVRINFLKEIASSGVVFISCLIPHASRTGGKRRQNHSEREKKSRDATADVPRQVLVAWLCHCPDDANYIKCGMISVRQNGEARNKSRRPIGRRLLTYPKGRCLTKSACPLFASSHRSFILIRQCSVVGLISLRHAIVNAIWDCAIPKFVNCIDQYDLHSNSFYTNTLHSGVEWDLSAHTK